jgi:hypothetical protein
MIKRVSLCLVILFLAGCAPYSLISANKQVDVNGFFVTPSKSWSKNARNPGKKAELWTSNGELLDYLILIGNIGDGEELLASASKGLPMPKFSSEMLAFDIENLVRTTLKNWLGGQLDIQTENLEPAKFGEIDGFRFSLNYYDSNGLLKTGDVLGAVKDEKLFLVIYSAADVYYYRARLPEVEDIFSSVVLST